MYLCTQFILWYFDTFFISGIRTNILIISEDSSSRSPDPGNGPMSSDIWGHTFYPSPYIRYLWTDPGNSHTSNSHMSSDIWGHTFYSSPYITSGTCGLTAGLYQRIHPLKILFIQYFKNLIKLARPKLQMTFYTKLPMFLPVLSETVCGLTWYHHGNDLPLLQPLHDWFTMNGLTTYSLKIELVDN